MQLSDAALRLRDNIQRLIDDGPTHDHAGICKNLGRGRWANHPVFAEELALFKSIAMSWPYYAGNPSFPVPAPKDFKGDRRPDSVYYADALGHWDGEYGWYRWDLVWFVKDYLDQQAANS